jgi:hypothetical protein
VYNNVVYHDTGGRNSMQSFSGCGEVTIKPSAAELPQQGSNVERQSDTILDPQALIHAVRTVDAICICSLHAGTTCEMFSCAGKFDLS